MQSFYHATIVCHSEVAEFVRIYYNIISMINKYYFEHLEFPTTVLDEPEVRLLDVKQLSAVY